MIRIAITGAAGRMGRSLMEACSATDGMRVTAAIVKPGSTLVGSVAGELISDATISTKIVDNIESVVDNFDV